MKVKRSLTTLATSLAAVLFAANASAVSGPPAEDDGQVDINVTVAPLAVLELQASDIGFDSAANNAVASVNVCLFSNTGDFSIDVNSSNNFKLNAGGSDNITYKITVSQGAGSTEFTSDSNSAVSASNEGLENNSTVCDGSSYPGSVTATLTEDGTTKVPGTYADTATILMQTI